MPLLFLCYLFSYLNRVNVGFAKPAMQAELGFSDAVYGLAAGMFFIGYIALEIPSNALMVRIGARRTFSRLIILWSLASGAMVLVSGNTSFYLLRLLLGAAEAGFSAGIVLYLTYVFPSGMRARAMTIITSSLALSGALGAPVSGLIIQNFDGVLGWSGWRWMFMLEALPSLVLGLIAMLTLIDRPDQAKWLTDSEKRAVSAHLAAEQGTVGAGEHRFRDAFRDWRVYVLSFTYFSIFAAASMISFWLPTFIADLGNYSAVEVGLLTALPYVAAGISMILLGWSSDRHHERRWHVGLSAGIGGLALVASVSVTNPLVAILLLSVAASGMLAAAPVFWAVPSAMLRGSAAAAGIAVISVFGALGGFVGPALVGMFRTMTGSTTLPVALLVVVVWIGVFALFAVTREPLREAG